MATPESVTVAYSRKVQLDDFEPVEHFAEMEVSLSEEDDPDDVYDEYSESVEDMVERAVASRVASKELESTDDE